MGHGVSGCNIGFVLVMHLQQLTLLRHTVRRNESEGVFLLLYSPHITLILIAKLQLQIVEKLGGR